MQNFLSFINYLYQICNPNEGYFQATASSEDLRPGTSSCLAQRTRGIKTTCTEEEEPVSDDPDYQPPRGFKEEIKKIRLMDANQSHTSDKKAISNRGLSDVLNNNTNKINELMTEKVEVKGASPMTVYRHRVKAR